MKNLCVIFIIILMVAMPIQINAEQNPIKVTVNDQQVLFDTPPYSEGGVILVPVRTVSEALGATVKWINELKTVIITKGDIQIKITLGSNKAYVNKIKALMNAPAKGKNSRIFVPVRFICESYGYKVVWEKSTNTVKITSPLKTDDNLILQQDKTMDSLKLSSGKINLNGYKLSVLGDLIQTGGTIEINNGQLKIKGNYKIETDDGKASKGILKMINTTDYVEVDGNFIMHSSQSHTGYLTSGLLAIKGNFTQKYGGSKTNFDASGEHITFLNGDDVQYITFENVGSSQFNIMKINKPLQVYEFDPPIKEGDYTR